VVVEVVVEVEVVEVVVSGSEGGATEVISVAGMLAMLLSTAAGVVSGN
jgi:hypothetical protein